MELTKEQYKKILEDIKLSQAFDKVNYEKMKEINFMFDDLQLERKGMFIFGIDTEKDKVIIKYESLDGKSMILYEHPNFDLLWDIPSWEIAKREIKDVFFDVRKKQKEKEEAAPRLTMLQRIKKYFKGIIS